MLGSNIRRIREKNKLTQKQVGDKVGCSQATLSKYENGALNIGADIVPVFADVLGVSIAELYGDEIKSSA